MDGKEIKNGQRYSCQLQVNEIVKYQWSLRSKYQANIIMQQIAKNERRVQKKHKNIWKRTQWSSSQEGKDQPSKEDERVS